MPYTAQIKTATDVCYSVTETPKPLSNPPAGTYFVTLDSYDTTRAGKKYTDGQWYRFNVANEETGDGEWVWITRL